MDMLTAITPFAKDYNFLPVKFRVVSKCNALVFEI